MKGGNFMQRCNQELVKTEQVASEATVVKLYAQCPPIEKMDDSLNTLENCQHLALSTNAIDRMIALPKLKNLEILSIGRNQIKRIMGLEEVGQSLKELWISYNQIEKLDGLQPCVRLHTLFIANNKIKSWDEISKLAQLPEIKTILTMGNPVYGEMTKEAARPYVVKRIPQIGTVDGGIISDAVRKEAESLD